MKKSLVVRMVADYKDSIAKSQEKDEQIIKIESKLHKIEQEK